jgi:hypothetical protein
MSEQPVRLASLDDAGFETLLRASAESIEFVSTQPSLMGLVEKLVVTPPLPLGVRVARMIESPEMARSRAAASGPVPLTPRSSANFSPSVLNDALSRMALMKLPLWRIARWNNPFASGDAMRAPTLAPPADWPKIVTRERSPPKWAMLSRTH